MFFPKRLEVTECFWDRLYETDKKTVPSQTQRMTERITIAERGLVTELTAGRLC